MSAKGSKFRSLFSKNSINKELSLDIGSANTRIYLNNKEVFSEPTCIAYHKGADLVISVGKKALNLLGKTPDSIEVGFPVQHGSIANTKYFELFISSVLNEVFPKTKLSRLIFGVKGNVAVMSALSPAKKRLLKNLLKKIGFFKVELVDSLYASALSVSGGDKKQLDNICIIDIGAQKTEIGVFSMGELVDSECFKWGGIQLTESLQKISRFEHKCIVGWRLAEEAKKEIGVLDNSRNKFVLRGKDIVSQSSKTIVFSSDDTRADFKKLFDSLLDNIQNFISRLPSETAISILDRGIFLTGGSSLVKGIDSAIVKRLKCDVFLSDSPKKDVVNGLTI